MADEAERVRLIFRRYLEVSGINELARDHKAKNICTKARTLRTTGNTRGGIPFGRKCSGAKLPTKSTRKSASVHRCIAIVEAAGDPTHARFGRPAAASASRIWRMDGLPNCADLVLFDGHARSRA